MFAVGSDFELMGGIFEVTKKATDVARSRDVVIQIRHERNVFAHHLGSPTIRCFQDAFLAMGIDALEFGTRRDELDAIVDRESIAVASLFEGVFE